ARQPAAARRAPGPLRTPPGRPLGRTLRPGPGRPPPPPGLPAEQAHLPGGGSSRPTLATRSARVHVESSRAHFSSAFCAARVISSNVSSGPASRGAPPLPSKRDTRRYRDARSTPAFCAALACQPRVAASQSITPSLPPARAQVRLIHQRRQLALI